MNNKDINYVLNQSDEELLKNNNIKLKRDFVSSDCRKTFNKWFYNDSDETSLVQYLKVIFYLIMIIKNTIIIVGS